MRADPAPRTLRPVLPHQARRPDPWAQYPDGSKPVRFGWFGRWSRRSRLAGTAVFVASLTLVGALVISSAQAVKAVASTNDQTRYGHSEMYPTPGSLPGDPGAVQDSGLSGRAAVGDAGGSAKPGFSGADAP